MKKLMIMLLAMALMAVNFTEAKTTTEKALQKEYKIKLKELKKAGYKVFGTSRTLEVMLAKHYEKLNALGDDAFEVSGIASEAKSKNVGQQMAVNNACLNYARMAGSTVRGRVAVDIAGNGSDSMAEFDNFFAAYESSIEKEIRGEMQQSLSLIKDNGNGTFEIQTFFIVNENSAVKARERAFEEARELSEAAMKHADKVSEYVRGRVEE